MREALGQSAGLSQRAGGTVPVLRVFSRLAAMTLRAKVCPSCHDAYLPQMSRCSDCGVDLVWETDAEVALALGEPGELGLSEEGVLLREAGAQWVGALAEALVDADIPCRIATTAAHAQGLEDGRPVAALPLGIFVAEADLARARELDAVVLRRQLPDLEQVGVAVAGELGAGDDGCPACGAAIAADAAECPECGLAFLA